MPERDNNVDPDAMAAQSSKGEPASDTVKKGRRLTVADILGRK